MKVSRRQFIFNSAKAAASVTLALKMSPLAWGEEEVDSAADVESKAGVLRVNAGRSRFFPAPQHVHYIEIPLEVFRNPPEDGVRLRSTESAYPWHHQHFVKLTQAQLMAVAKGESVTVNDGNFDHHWKVSLTSQRANA